MKKVLILTILIFMSGCNETYPGNNDSSWEIHKTNPIISYGQAIPNMIWNDPSVMKEGDTYRMWLSGGTGKGRNPAVNIYEASSTDGITWDIKTTPLVKPGPDGSWDDERIETPAVIKIKDVYHMYYCGCTKKGDEGNRGIYNIGHAISTDGIHWKKDKNNPIISHTSDPLHWGFYTAGEPGIIHIEGTFYLYYCTVKSRPGYEGKPGIEAMQGICLATSTDGSEFTHYDADNDGYRDAVLTQSNNYPASNNYIGYSTPWALVANDGKIHLFYDVIKHPWQQIAIAHAVSSDGFSFTEVEHNIIKKGSENWLGHEVRAPTVIEEDNNFKMWYAGHTNWFASSGIGYAGYKEK